MIEISSKLKFLKQSNIYLNNSQISLFHVTRYILGGVHMKNQPVLPWKVKRELDAKNKSLKVEVAELPQEELERLMYIEIERFKQNPDIIRDEMEQEKRREWTKARKIIDLSRLFGPYPNVSTHTNAEAITIEAKSIE
mmetsp:Transcript_1049/g.1591  ORF Transcript_1049/g.1591 Transcript_1049/m.1591 type:complete len:138 (+) Transcript_1049:43-456(+)